MKQNEALQSLATMRYDLKQMLKDPKATANLSQEQIDEINLILENSNETKRSS